MSVRWLAPVITLGAVAVGLAVVFDLAALRMVLALAICLLLPGWGWARRLRTRDRMDTLALAVVLSICATVTVSTAMVVTARWSTVGGLAALVVIGAIGLVPGRELLARLQGTARLRPVAVGGPSTEIEQPSETDWVDWYAGARRRAAEERARTRALQRQADEEWAEWFRTAHPERAAGVRTRQD